MAPTPERVTVALDALRKQATGWAERATDLGDVADEIGEYTYTTLQAGLFLGFVDKYDEVVAQMQTRLREGELAMKEIARTLNTVAGVYEDEERAQAHAIHNLY
ncbi:type VII secretion target [Nocardia sp. NPDC050697]|uniref:type VII secretion target n=1 Tax=Nocardia sp. NPDC050697 TaxID=3155158 RepID=UPI0033EEA342